MSTVWCICGMKLATINDGKLREMSGLCVSCQETNDCRKSAYWDHARDAEDARRIQNASAEKELCKDIIPLDQTRQGKKKKRANGKR